MKKIICAVLAFALLLTGLCGCGRKAVAKDAFRICISNHSGEKIRGINLRLTAGDGTQQSVYLGKGDNGVVLADEQLSYDFTDEKFKDLSHLLDCVIEVTVVAENGDSVPATNDITISIVSFGEAYYYSMDGSAKNGYHLSKTAKPY